MSDSDSNTYPVWIKLFLCITAGLGIIRAFVDLLTNLMLFEASVAVIHFLGSLLLFIGIVLILNRKFWGYIFYCVVLISQYPISYYLYGSVNNIVYFAIFVRLIVVSSLVFIPFKRGHSLYHAMKPIKPIFHLPSAFGMKWVRNKGCKEDLLTEQEDGENNEIVVSTQEFDNLIIEDNGLVSNNSSEEVHNERINNNANSHRINHRNIYVAAFLIIALSAIFGFIYLRKDKNFNVTYYVDSDGFIHADPYCVSATEPIEHTLVNSLYLNAVQVDNVTSPLNNIHFCGKCISSVMISDFRDSVSTYTKKYWGTINSDSLELLTKNINWLYNHFEHKYRWNNSFECLRFFRNNTDNALKFYSENCQDWNLGEPDEFMDILEVLMDKKISSKDMELLCRKKKVYNAFIEYNYEMPKFDKFISAIEKPVTRDQLYHTMVTEMGRSCNEIPLQSSYEFDTWLGY